MLYTFDAGLRVTLRDLITQMIITSDNTATDMLLDRVGGLEALNAWLTSAGFPNTRMLQSTLSFFRQPLELVDPKYRSLPPEDIFAYWLYPYRDQRPADAIARGRLGRAPEGRSVCDRTTQDGGTLERRPQILAR